MTTRFPARCLAGGLLLTALILTTGCKGEKPTATVSGKVMYNGKPQTVGYVNFLSTTGSAAQMPLDENGNFKSDSSLDAVEFKVYLQGPIPGQAPPGTKVAPTAKFNVTPKFLQPDSSGVKVTLKPGANDGIVIEMKD
jgi:hypothetical protein